MNPAIGIDVPNLAAIVCGQEECPSGQKTNTAHLVESRICSQLASSAAPGLSVASDHCSGALVVDSIDPVCLAVCHCQASPGIDRQVAQGHESIGINRQAIRGIPGLYCGACGEIDD